MKFTPHLKNLIQHYRETLPPEEFENLHLETHRLMQVWVAKLAALPTPADRAARVHREVDALNDSLAHIAVSCRKGCSFCCHLEVEITADDADRLAEFIVREGILPAEDRLEEQTRRPRLDPSWSQGLVPQNRCVFLGQDDACQVYEARPTICRKHMVVTAPEECYVAGGNPVPRLVPMAEIILSAALSLDGQETGSLPRMLVKSLDKLLAPRPAAIHELDFLDDEPETPPDPGPARPTLPEFQQEK